MDQLDRIIRHAHESNSGGFNPYHNNKHMIEVARLADRLYKAESYVPTVPVAGDVQRAILLTAAMLHDLNHTGGAHKDNLNIHFAIDGIRAYLHEYPKEFVEAVVDLVKLTEYPFVKEPVTIIDKCMRDADILYAVMSGEPKIIMEDLRQEMECFHNKPISYEEMLEGQLKFNESVVTYTVLGGVLWKKHSVTYTEQLKEYVQLKNSEN